MFVLTLLLACNNDCSYYERCDGDTLLVCGEAADQQVNRQVNEVPCEAPNAVCVEVGENNATCAQAAEPCVEGQAPTCEGDLLLTCEPFRSAIGLLGDGSDQSFVQAVDCAALEKVCGADGDTVTCVAAVLP
jgi:hypothetical protein